MLGAGQGSPSSAVPRRGLLTGGNGQGGQEPGRNRRNNPFKPQSQLITGRVLKGVLKRGDWELSEPRHLSSIDPSGVLDLSYQPVGLVGGDLRAPCGTIQRQVWLSRTPDTHLVHRQESHAVADSNQLMECDDRIASRARRQQKSACWGHTSGHFPHS